jgi:hypothetical protein
MALSGVGASLGYDTSTAIFILAEILGLGVLDSTDGFGMTNSDVLGCSSIVLATYFYFLSMNTA